jgi:uncharacterized membrane protein HdeD (DUF308 family)
VLDRTCSGREGEMLGTSIRADAREAVQDYADGWWWFLVAGLVWLVVSVVVFRFDISSVTTIGVLIGALFIVAALDEVFVASVRKSWAWAHWLLSVLFVLGAIWSFVSPQDAFWALASVFGLLLIFSGTLDIVQSTVSRAVNPLWGLGLATGILEILLGFWASQQFVPARGALLILWVGFLALFRGLSDIVLAFEVRSVKEELT